MPEGPETTNYHLYLTNDNSMRFVDWRNQINGPIDSNMIKIDAILADKATISQAILKTLSAQQWTVSGSVPTQDIAIAGLTADQNGFIGAAQNLTAAQTEAVQMAGLCISGQRDGILTIAANGELPSCDIPVIVILLG